MDCKACRKEIDLAARGEEVRRAEARAHLSVCPKCREFRSEREALKELVASVGPTLTAPPDFDWKLRARLAAEKNGRASVLFRRGFAPGLQPIAFAAAFALLIATAVYFKQARTERPSPTPTVATAHAPATNALALREADSRKTNSSAVSRQSSDGQANVLRAQARANVRSVARAVQVKGSGIEATAQAVASNGGNSLRSNDFSSGVAPVITLFSVPVRTPAQPVKVLLDEGSGTLRTVALQPVTFGSQEILRRSSAGDAPYRQERSQERGAEEIW